MEQTAIMIDIETLGTSKNSVILAIGAVEFNSTGIVNKFYGQIDPSSCQDWGLVIDARTVMWWMDQNDAARKALTSTQGGPLDIVLKDFAAAFKWKGKNVWANGIDFDLTILEEAFKAVGLPVPWPYWAKFDYRTIKNLAPRAMYDTCKEEAGVAHHALGDAMSQAATLINLSKRLNWVEPEPAVKVVPNTGKKGTSRAVK